MTAPGGASGLARYGPEGEAAEEARIEAEATEKARVEADAE